MIVAKSIYRVAVPIYRHYHKTKVANRFPFLDHSRQKFKETTDTIKQKYDQYIKEVSTPDMAVSLETAVFLQVFCEGLKPKCILDLGSGFSSFVLRSYAACQTCVTVWSVDDSPEWLERTQSYLASNNLSTNHLMLWSEFQNNSQLDPFDLIFHDLGNMNLRRDSLRSVLKLAEAGHAILLLDDMHKAPYAKYVRDSVRHCSCQYFDLASYTLDRFGRYCGLVIYPGISSSRCSNKIASNSEQTIHAG